MRRPINGLSLNPWMTEALLSQAFEKSILIATHDKAVTNNLVLQFEDKKWQVQSFSEPAAAVQSFRNQPVSVALVDIGLPRLDGISLAKSLKDISSSVIIILMTGYKTLNVAIDELKSPGYDYILKPVLIEHLFLIIRRAHRELILMEQNSHLLAENAKLRGEASIEEIASTSETVEKDTKAPGDEEQLMPLKIATLTGPKARAIATYERQQHTIRTKRAPENPDETLAEKSSGEHKSDEGEIESGDEK